MNDTSIGNTGSGATTSGPWTFQLYSTLYTSVSDTWAPVSGGRTAPGNSMAAAITDFLAGKTLTMPLSLGRALAGAGAGAGLTSRALGQNTGAETVTLTSANMPVGTPTNASASGNNFITNSGTTSFRVPQSAGIYSQGSATPVATMQPTSFMNVFIKL